MGIHLIKELINERKKMFYVYLLWRPNKTPMYVGKGTGWRIFHHEKLATGKCIDNGSTNEFLKSTIRKILRNGGIVSYSIDNFFNNEAQAYEREIDLIEKYGRLDIETGCLCNLDSGGKGGARNWSKKMRRKMGETQTRTHAERPELRIQQGKTRSQTFQDNPEIVKNIGKNRKQFNIDNPEKYQKNQQNAIEAARTPEARSKNSQEKIKWFREEPIKVEQRDKKIRETTQSEVFREEASKRNKISHNTPEAKENISVAQKKRFEDPEQRKNARDKALKNANLKKVTQVKIQSLIKIHNLTNITIPDGRSSIKKFQELEEKILKIVNTPS